MWLVPCTQVSCIKREEDALGERIMKIWPRGLANQSKSSQAEHSKGYGGLTSAHF